MLSWMVWTTPVAVFFSCVALLLVVMTVWELRSPTVLRKGFLPVATTRGDRLFIGLLSAGYINLIWLGLGERMASWFGLPEEPSTWIGAAISAVVLVVIMARG
jgi:predicted small integral membrane protein